MIEIIYDKNKDKPDAEKNEEELKEDNAVSIGLKLPKNIRQIGTPSGNKRIYIEDYVVTYLNYIARPGSTHARGAVLLGECKRSDVGDVIFISGAVDAQNIEFDMDESEFTQEAWTEIYEQVKEFFPSLSVVGWFLSRMGFSTAINDKIEKMHVDNFPGKDKVLFITDSLECEDAFYMYERGQLIKQKGYFIYYAKNEAMQNYIIKQKGGIADEENSEIKRKDDELIKNYRERNSRMQGNKPAGGISLVYVASSFVVLALLAMGITMVSNYDKMKEMEVSINRLELTAEQDDGEDYSPVIATEDDEILLATQTDTNTTTDADTVTEAGTEEITTETVDTGTDNPGDEDDISTEQTLPAMTDGNPTYYTIKLGDSLGSIAYEYYGDVKYAEDIAEANNMNVDDKIYEGQKIILPSIKAR